MAATLSKTGTEKVTDWKARLEELELQLNLGKMEAEERFETGRKKFRQFIHEVKDRLHEFEDIEGGYKQKLETLAEETRLKLELGKMDAQSEFAEARKDLKKSLEALMVAYYNAREKGDPKYTELQEKLEEEIAEFRTKLDTYWLHLNLGKADLKDEVETRKRELRNIVNDLKNRLDESWNAGGEKWNDFTDEFREAFEDYGDF